MKNRSNIGPIASLANNAAAARFWFVAFCLAAGTHLIVPVLKVITYRPLPQVVVIDETGTIHIAPLKGFDEENRLHADSATFAVLALFQRNPNGLDFGNLFEDVFRPKAKQKGLELLKQEMPFFKAKNVQQTPKITRIRFLETSASDAVVITEGYLSRTGSIDRQSVEIPDVPFKIRWVLVANPDLTKKGRYPMAVSDFEVRYAQETEIPEIPADE